MMNFVRVLIKSREIPGTWFPFEQTIYFQRLCIVQVRMRGNHAVILKQKAVAFLEQETTMSLHTYQPTVLFSSKITRLSLSARFIFLVWGVFFFHLI